MRTHFKVCEDGDRFDRKLIQCATCDRFGYKDDFKGDAEDCIECEQENCDHEYDPNEGGLCLNCGKLPPF